MVCKQCDKDSDEGLGNDFEFTKVQADNVVVPGTKFNVYVDVFNNSYFFSDKGRVCIYDENQVIASSDQFELDANKTIRLHLTGIMPNYPLYLNVSAVKEKLGFTRCEDGHALFIDAGNVPDLVNPSDDEYEEKDQTISEWIQENIILVLVLLLIIIAMLKFA